MGNPEAGADFLIGKFSNPKTVRFPSLLFFYKHINQLNSSAMSAILDALVSFLCLNNRLQKLLHLLSTYKNQTFQIVKTKMTSAQPLLPSLGFSLSSSLDQILQSWLPYSQKWSQNANGSFHHRVPFLSYSSSPSLHPSSALCSRFSPSHPSLPSLFPLSFHPLRFLLTSMATTQVANDSSRPSQTKTVRIVIRGRVQGVFYRNWTIENATLLRLKGWVRNRRDGSVGALFSGSLDAVHIVCHGY